MKESEIEAGFMRYTLLLDAGSDLLKMTGIITNITKRSFTNKFLKKLINSL
ncbi:MAG TPA: hypothetical protein VLA74_02270 [Nitrososphaeraceae archaeon]|nr:hypothetical protein [Nitrososphaeraceae archaeon]